MSLASGVVLVLLGLLGLLASAHFKGLRYFDRPAVARNARFDPLLDGLKWTLLAAGLVLLFTASRATFAVVAGALAALWAYRRVIRSASFQARLLRRDFIALRREQPGLSDEEILFELAYRRHPRWGPELVEQMVRDYPTVESFARMMSRMERGFRGFRGRRPAAR